MRVLPICIFLIFSALSASENLIVSDSDEEGPVQGGWVKFSCASDKRCRKSGTLALETRDVATVTLSLQSLNLTSRLNLALISARPRSKKNKDAAARDFHLLQIHPDQIIFDKESTLARVNVTAKKAAKTGFLEISTCQVESDGNTTCPIDLTRSFLLLTIMKSVAWDWVIDIVGWIYFAAWSISFYPQVFLNYRRKSVYGLNFDFLALNFTGFLCYSIYNCALFWNPTVIAEFKAEHPRSAIPVEPNDVAFAVHALLITIFTIFQCFIYDRGNQRVSFTCWGILGVLWLYFFIILILGGVGEFDWYSYVSYVTYIKLVVTIIKYIPQAYYNFRRKSTVGWSIGNIILDFTGGSMSLLQLFLQCYNYDDWTEPFTDPTKFGLGLFSVLFDVLFMVQHYILYRGNGDEHKKIDSEKEDDEGQINPVADYGSNDDFDP